MIKSYKITNSSSLSAKREVNADDLILISNIANRIPYNQEYLSLLIRRGKVYGEKIGRNWHISQKSLEAYLTSRSSVFLLKIYKSNLLGVLANNTGLIKHHNVVGYDLNNQISLVAQENAPKANLMPKIRKELDELEKIYKERLGVVSNISMSSKVVSSAKEQSILLASAASHISSDTEVLTKNSLRCKWKKLQKILMAKIPDP